MALGVPPLDPADADSPSDAWAFIYMWGVTRTDGQIDVAGTAVTPIEVSTDAAGLAHKRRRPDGTWTDWTMLSNPPGGLSEDITPVLVAGALHVCLTHKDNTVTHRSQADQGGAWTDWTNLGAPDASAIANPALILDSENYLNLLLTRPAKDGMITLRQSAGGQFVTGPAIPALPPH